MSSSESDGIAIVNEYKEVVGMLNACLVQVITVEEYWIRKTSSPRISGQYNVSDQKVTNPQD